MKSPLLIALSRFIFALWLVAYVPNVGALTIEDGGTLYDVIPTSGRQEVSPANDTRKAIIVVHGWNPSATPYDAQHPDGAFGGAEFMSLVSNIRGRLRRPDNADWKMILYHWERDAATGPIFFADVTDPLFGIGYPVAAANGIRAAQNGYTQGSTLGANLGSAAPNLQELHFIAHSAGTWVVYAAIQQLLLQHPNRAHIKIHVTLLDPFIPDALWWTAIVPGNMGDTEIEQFGSVSTISFRENYFAKDITPATEEVFSAWPSQTSINRQIDWVETTYSDTAGATPSGTFSHYDDHGGPVVFYSDTVKAASDGIISSDLAHFSNVLSRIGWTQSPFFKEHVFIPPPPVNAPPTPPNFRATFTSAAQINLQWNDVAGETLYRILRSNNGINYVQTTTRAANETAYSDKTVFPGRIYYYQLIAENAGGASKPSLPVLAATSPVQPGTPGAIFSLLVDAVDPAANQILAVNVSSWAGVSSDFRTNTTRFTRSVAEGTQLTVSAPATLTGGRVFQYWVFDSATRTYSTTAVTTMNGNHAFIAVYGATPPPARTLSSLAIEGPSSVDERSTATYKAKATFTDGSTAYVNPSWDEDSNYADISSAGLFDAEAVSSDRTVEVEATYTSGGVTKVATKNVTIRNVASAQTYTLTRSVVGGGSIGYSPQATNYAAGTVVSLHGNKDSGWLFSHWSGDASGSDDDTTVRMDGNRSVTAYFVADTSEGGLRVNLSPAQVVTEAAQWKYRNYTAWRDSGDTQNFIPVGTGYVHFKDIPGWVTPDEVQATILGGQTITVNATYREIKGAVQVTITPQQAADAGARWRLNGGAWQEGGATLSDPPTGTNSVEFLAIAGWSTPPNQTITVARGVTTTSTGDYGPPAGFPIITSVAPRTGPIVGGTIVTIEGVNFLPGATVIFGGVPAASVAVVSSTRITAITPARASYGTVPLVLNSGGQTVTQANGFSYLNPLGSNIELVGQIGGNVDAIAVVGSLCYYGEGTSLVVVDVSNSAAPVERGRIALPSAVRDIAVSGTTALVACRSQGLYAVNISDPAAPAIVGFYETTGGAYGVKIDDNKAFVATAYSGLAILDVSNPAAIVQLGSLDTAGRVDRLAVGNVGLERYAFLAEGDLALRIVRVTVPGSPVEVAAIPAQTASGFADVKVVGTKLYASDQSDAGVRIFDISTPSSPVQTSSFSNVGLNVGIDIIGTRIYACDGLLRVGNLATTPVTQLGIYTQTAGNRVVVANNLAFLAGGSGGLRIISVSNPASMILQSKIDVLGGVQEIVVSNSVAFVGNGSGLHTVSVSNPARPSRLASLTGSGVWGLVVADGKATLVQYGSTTVRIANVTNPSALSLYGTYTGVDARNVALLGTTPVLSAATKDSAHLPMIDVLNLAAPSSPQRRASLSLDSSIGSADCIAISDPWAFVGRSGKALDIVSLANPDSPQKMGSVGISGSFYDVAASADGNFVYVPIEGEIRVFDTTTKSAPAIVSPSVTSPFSGTVFVSVYVAGRYLYAGSTLQLHVFDISNPAAPQLVAYYDNPGYGNAVQVVGDLLYLADSQAGVIILRLNDVDKPTIAITSPTTNTTLPTVNSSVTLGGTATDLRGVVRVTWENDRGGGGVASGITAWQIPNIQLAAGVNVLTVTAEDANGNRATDSLTVTASFPDTTPPVITITGPKPDAEFSTEAATITVSGSVVDNRQITAVNWVDNHGHTGTATLNAQSWNIAGVALEIGPSVITVTATDAAGNSAADVATILRTPLDAAPPSIAIAFPTPATEFATSEATLNVSGEASDDVGVKEIRWSNNRGGSGIATGTALWAVNGIALQTGLNSVTLTVEDEAGKTSEDNLAVTYTPSDADGDGIADAWEMQFFGNLATANPSTDTGSTGVPDFLKFALGMDPTFSGLLALPQSAIDEEGQNTYLALKYRQLMVPGNLVYQVGVSGDLMTWDYSESLIEQIGLPVPTGDGVTEEVTVRLTVPVETLGRAYLRLKVLKTP